MTFNSQKKINFTFTLHLSMSEWRRVLGPGAASPGRAGQCRTSISGWCIPSPHTKQTIQSYTMHSHHHHHHPAAHESHQQTLEGGGVMFRTKIAVWNEAISRDLYKIQLQRRVALKAIKQDTSPDVIPSRGRVSCLDVSGFKMGL